MTKRDIKSNKCSKAQISVELSPCLTTHYGSINVPSIIADRVITEPLGSRSDQSCEFICVDLMRISCFCNISNYAPIKKGCKCNRTKRGSY